MPTQRYTAFGLCLETDLILDELPPSPPTREPDVRIAVGKVPAALADKAAGQAWWEAAPDRLLVKAEGIANFLVTGGNRIVIDPEIAPDSQAVRLYLFGSAMGGILHQRRILPIHGSSVAFGGGAVLLTGRQRAGKSTLAAALARRGHPLISDDVSAIDQSRKHPLIQPSFPQSKLWADALVRLGESPDGRPRVRPDLDKFACRMVDMFRAEPAPLRHLVLLHPTPEVEAPQLEPVVGHEALRLIIANTYRLLFVNALDRQAAHFNACGKLARDVQCWRLRRPEDGCTLAELVAHIEALAATGGVGSYSSNTSSNPSSNESNSNSPSRTGVGA